MKKALATFCMGPMLELARLLRPSVESYAQRWGYDFHDGSNLPGFDPLKWSTEVQSKHPSWAKLDMMHRLLDLGYEGILWLDADIIVLDDSKDIVDELVGLPDLAYVLSHSIHRGWGVHPNAGMLFVTSHGVLDAIEKAARECRYPAARKLWEQVGVLQVVGISIDWRFNRPSPQKKPFTTEPPVLLSTAPEPTWSPDPRFVLQELPREWNFIAQTDTDTHSLVRFGHVCGMPIEDRIRWIREKRIGGYRWT